MRKSLKRARAMLRLLRTSMSGSSYRRENASLRDCSRLLGAVRDSRALLDTAAKLSARAASARERSLVSRLRTGLKHAHARARRNLCRYDSGMDSLRMALQASYRRSNRWCVRAEGKRPVGDGTRRVYARGRAACARAQAHPTAQNLHELRKQTKYLYHQLEALEPLRPGLITALANRAHHLADLLGDDHNLAVLRTRIAHSTFGRVDRTRLRRLVDHEREKLDREALKAAGRIYLRSPTAFAARLARPTS